MFVADPEVPRGVTESLTVDVPTAVKEQYVGAVVLLYKYPAFTAGRRLARLLPGGIDSVLLLVIVTS